ncbi:uncharacterized protein LOC134538797 [Bacillus rossius redtenbacheri]|uniref:uncharacterized protein LOC134538797 n=1 Tax=Bacillus rossius redtenbacheri TaxID=93214 RepID=UPI002FDE14B0
MAHELPIEKRSALRAKACGSPGPPVELRGGVLYSSCDCRRRNGLQDRCPRTGCGIPECLDMPEPTCIPSGGPGPKPRDADKESGATSRVVGQCVRQCPDCCCPVLCTTVQTDIPEEPAQEEAPKYQYVMLAKPCGPC